MSDNTFKLLLLVIPVLTFAITAIIVPQIWKWLKSKTTEEQRKALFFWSKLAVKWAEDLYKQVGAGPLKRDQVILFLRKAGFNLTEEQFDILIALIVAEFNKYGWDKPLEDCWEVNLESYPHA